MAVSKIIPPLGGVGRKTAFQHQEPFEAYDLLNYWPIDAKTGRQLIATRPKLQEIGAPTPTTPSIINMIAPINGVRMSFPFESLVIVASDGDGDADGAIYYYNGTGWTAATGAQATAVDDDRAVYGASILSSCYIPVTGGKPIRFQYGSGGAATLVETAGTCPTGNTIAVVWQGSLCLAGNAAAPNIFYQSRIGDPLDWDFTAAASDLAGAYFTSGEDEGRISGPITALIPQNSETLIVSATTGLIAMRGHPRRGGVFEPLGSNFYALGQGAWAKVPGDILFFLSKQGLVRLDPNPGAVPTAISKEKIPKELLGLTYNIDDPTVAMHYDSRWHGLVITVRGNSEDQAWWYDIASGGFFRMRYESYPWVMYEHPPFITDLTSGLLQGRYDGIHRFDMFATDETMQSSAIIGPVRISPDDHKQSRISKMRALFGRDTPSSDISGRLRVATGVDGQDAVSKMLLGQHQFQVDLSKLQDDNGVFYPLLSGNAMVIGLTTEDGDLALEQFTADVMPAGMNWPLRGTQLRVVGVPTTVFEDTDFDPDTWTGFSEATPDAPTCTELPDHSCFIDLSELPATWWAQVATDGGDIRATDDNNAQLPLDLINFDYGANTGFAVVKVTQTMASPTPVRLWVGRPGMAQPAATDTYGQYNAYDSSWKGFWPDGGGSDRTVEQNSFTHVNSTAGDSAGPIGVSSTDYDESNHSGSDSYAFIDNPPVSDHPLTLVAWGKRNAGGTSLDFMGITSGLLNHNRMFLNWDGSNISFARIVSVDSSTSGTADSSTSGELVTTWQHIAATAVSDAERNAFINGGGKGTDTTSLTMSTFDTLMLGRARSKTVVSTTYNGKIALAQLHGVERSDCWIAYQAGMRDQTAFWNGWTAFTSGGGTPPTEPDPPTSACPSGLVSVSETGTWAGYDEFTADPIPANADGVSNLFNFSFWVDLSLMSATWWSNVASDGSDIRATDTGNVFLPLDLIEFDSVGNTGFAVVRANASTTAGPTIRLWVGNGSAVTVPACAAYGQYRAYDQYTEGFWPFGGGTDRTAWQRTLTASGSVVESGIAGPVGATATRFNGTSQFFSGTTVPASGTSATDTVPLTMFSTVRVNAPDTWHVAQAISLSNDDNEYYALHVTPSIEPMVIVIHSNSDQWLTNPDQASIDAWVAVTCEFGLDSGNNSLTGRIIVDTTTKQFSGTGTGLLAQLTGLNQFTLGAQRLTDGTGRIFLDGDMALASLHSAFRSDAWSLYNQIMLTQSSFWTTPAWTASSSSLPQP